MVAEKLFRADLFYRLKVFPIFSPPLRDRVSDIPMLVRHFVATHSRRMGKNIEKISDETMDALKRWKWPGNIRELENLLERAVILTRGPVLYVPLAELDDADDEQAEEAETENPQPARRRTRTYITSAAGSERPDRRPGRRGGTAGRKKDHAEFKVEEAGHRARRLLAQVTRFSPVTKCRLRHVVTKPSSRGRGLAIIFIQILCFQFLIAPV